MDEVAGEVREYTDVDNPLLVRDDKGGKIALLTGIPGSGKTTLMIHLAKRILFYHPRELVYYRFNDGCQWVFAEPSECVFLLQGLPDKKYVFVNKKKEKPFNPEDLGIKVRYCYEPRDMLLKAEHGKINFFFHYDKQFFVDFCDVLIKKWDDRWVSIFYDEAQQLMPFNMSGEEYDLIVRDFIEGKIASFRSNKISFIAACHDYALNLHWSYRSKVQYYVLLTGATPPRHVRLKYKAFERDGIAWITDSCSFGYYRFPKYTPLGDFTLNIYDIFEASLYEEREGGSEPRTSTKVALSHR